MLGAIAGDIIGSRFERHNIKSMDFELFTDQSCFTDDSVMTLAIAHALIDCEADPLRAEDAAARSMRQVGRTWPHAGYGARFKQWLASDDPQPCGSYGNGAAMRVSPCAWAAKTLETALELARRVTRVTHGHPESIRAAEAVTSAIWLARHGASPAEIGRHLKQNYYTLDFTLDEIRPCYRFDVSCQGSVPQALEAFLEADGFESAVRLAISIGGDSDTIAAIAGSVAEAAYGIPDALREEVLDRLERRQILVLEAFREVFHA